MNILETRILVFFMVLLATACASQQQFGAQDLEKGIVGVWVDRDGSFTHVFGDNGAYHWTLNCRSGGGDCLGISSPLGAWTVDGSTLSLREGEGHAEYEVLSMSRMRLKLRHLRTGDMKTLVRR